MSSKVCVLLGLNHTLADYLAHTCSDGSHIHYSRSQLRPLIQANRVVLCRGSLGETRRQEAKRREQTVVWILPAEEQVTKRPSAVGRLNAGLSYKVGEYLAKQIRNKEPWALVMFAELRRRHLRESEVDNDPRELQMEASCPTIRHVRRVDERASMTKTRGPRCAQMRP